MRPVSLLLLLICAPLFAETGESPADASDDIDIPANVSQLITEERPLASLAPNRCARCHEVENLVPTMRLPFRPYDKLGRQNWVLEHDPKTVQEALGRLKRVLFDTPQMPPADSEEAKGFDRESAENRALKAFLETGLEKAAEPAPAATPSARLESLPDVGATN